MKTYVRYSAVIFFLFAPLAPSVFSEEFFQAPPVSWLDTQSRFTEITLDMMEMIYDKDYKDTSFSIAYVGFLPTIVIYPELQTRSYGYNDWYNDKPVYYEDTIERALFNSPIDAMWFSKFEYVAFALNYMQNIPVNPKTISEDLLPLEIILNAGLIFTSPWASLGGYVGVDYRGEQVNNPFDAFKFNYWILPSLGLTNYSFIGKLLKTLCGHINIMESSVKGYSGRLIVQSFEIGKITISTMDYYYKKEPFNSEASNEVFGVRIGFNNVFHVEGGYQKYFDINKPPTRYREDGSIDYEIIGFDSFYKDGPFLNLAYSWIKTDGLFFTYSKTTLNGGWSSRYFPFPKLGLDIELGENLKLLKCTLELYLSKDLIEVSIGITFTGIFKHE